MVLVCIWEYGGVFSGLALGWGLEIWTMLEDSLEDVKQLGNLPLASITDGVFYIRRYLIERSLDTTLSGRRTFLATQPLGSRMWWKNIFWCRSWQIVHRRNLLLSCPCPCLLPLLTEMWSRKGGYCFVFLLLKKKMLIGNRDVYLLLPIVCFISAWLGAVCLKHNSQYSIL